MSKIDETILKLRAFIEDITIKENEKNENLEPEDKEKVNAIANKTIQTIQNSIQRIDAMKDQIFDENEMNEFLDRLIDKCQDITDFTVTKMNEVKPRVRANLADLKEELDKGFEEIKNFNFKSQAEESYEKILENENVKKAIQFAKDTKDKAIEFYNKPQTQEAINNAKLKIIDVAEKGLDTLKVILEKEDDNQQNKGE